MNININIKNIQTSVGNLYFEEYKNNSSSKKTLLFIHGLAGDSSSYQPIIKHLIPQLPNYNFISIDLPGYGNSVLHFPLKHSNYIEVCTDSIKQLLEAENIHHYSVVAQSLGCSVALDVANDLLEKPEHVFLISPIPRKKRLLPSILPITLLNSLAKRVKVQTKKRSLNELLKYKHTFDYSIPRTLSDIQSLGFLYYLIMWLPIFSWSIQDFDFAKFSKTHINYIYGKKDRLVFPFAHNKMLARLPNSKIFAINSNHNLVINMPNEIAKIIVEQLSKR